MSGGPDTPGVAGTPRLLLRLEGGALFILGVLLFWRTGMPWWLFPVLFFAPDLSFAVYLAGPRLGALAYNAVHVTLGPILLWLAGTLFDQQLAVALAAIWAGHVGLDRALGYGLKYPTAFTDTHLGPIGSAARR